LKASVSGEGLGIGSRKVPRGLRGRHVVKEHQRKLGTSRGSPRHMRICTAKASGISRETVKSRCAREWGGWGRLSDDGPGQNNPDRSEGPWGRAAWFARTEVLTSTSSLTQSREYRWQRRAQWTVANRLPRRPRVSIGKALSDIPALEPYWLCCLPIYVALGQ
jgi:hypothetical protein